MKPGWLRLFSPPEPPPVVYNKEVEWNPERPEPRLASVSEIDSWLTAAEQREFQVFRDIHQMLILLEHKWPLRTRMFRKELKWLRREARKEGFSWGSDT